MTTVLVGGAAAVIQVATALAGLILARGLGPLGYGQVAYFFSIMGIVVLAGSLGLTTQVTREVARLTAREQDERRGDELVPMIVFRVATVGAIAALGMLLQILGDHAAGMAAVGGSVALLTGFTLGAIQGIGRPRLAALLQCAQAVLYFAVVVSWAQYRPERVFVSVVGSYAVIFLASLLPCHSVAVYARRWVRRGWQPWADVITASGLVYLLTLLLAPFNAVAVLALGHAGRFSDAANMSVALSIVLLPTLAVTMVISVQYFPQLCQQVERDRIGARDLFDRFYRLFVVIGIAAAVSAALFAPEVVVVLYSAKYVAAATTVIAAAPVAALLSLGQMAAWTLVAHGRIRWALAGAATELGALAIGISLTLAIPNLSLPWLGVAHTVAAAAGFGVWAGGLVVTGAASSWRPGTLGAALAAATATGWMLRQLAPLDHAGRIGAILFILFAGACIVVVTGATVIVLEPGRVSAWVGRYRGGFTRV